MAKQQEDNSRYNLVTGEDSYSGAYAQNPATARRLQSLIPSISGELARELGEVKFNGSPAITTGGGKVGALFQYDYNDASGNQHTTRFAATSNTLYQEIGGVWTSIILPTLTGLLLDYPQFQNINNILHFSDGTNSFIYDGPNNAFELDGFPIPLDNPVSVDGGAGNITTLVDKFYWFTYADEVTGRVHESSSSVISASIGAITSRQRTVSPTRGTVTTTLNNPAIVGTGTNFLASQVNMALYVNGALFGIIVSVTDTTHLQLNSGQLVTAVTNGSILIVPQRASHVHIYGSEIDGSKLGFFHGKISVSANPPTFTDNSPFTNQANTTILNINRPIRNDPPPASRILEVHKYRLFRRRETIPNRFNFTANEEVASGTNGAPQESVPGADPNTLSDIINETAYPRPASAIRAIKSHADALYLGTEKEIIPLWGDTIGLFALSEVVAIDGGAISRWGLESLTHGLAIFSYDRKLYIYPPISPIWALTPQDINITDQLVEIGRSMRNKFLKILSSDIQNVRILKYRYNVRDWLVVCYQDTSNVYHTYIYDFETKGWLELQRGFVSVAIFETSPGIKVLVGGGIDGFVYVVDDVTGAFVNTLNLPTALFRTSLMDFGEPTMFHEPDYLEIEVNNAAIMDSSTTVNFYLDPKDADNPGNPIPLTMFPVQDEPLLYRGFFATAQGGMGVICKRLMVELNLISDTNSGTFRSISIKANPVTNLIK